MTMRTTALAALAAVAVLAATPAVASIAGSAHDFSGDTWSGNTICKPCHTPHDADIINVTGAPLWNHALSEETYTPYDSDTFQGTVDEAGLGHYSVKLCLSCHDGTVALDSFGGTTGTNMMTGPAVIGTDLNSEHPVGFIYNAALAASDGELYNPAVAEVGATTKTIEQFYLFGATGSAVMGCASCHDVHNTATGTNGNMLRRTQDQSTICLDCHAK